MFDLTFTIDARTNTTPLTLPIDKAVNAIVPLCAAAPGVRSFLDLPLIRGRSALAV